MKLFGGCAIEMIDCPDLQICKVLDLYMHPQRHFHIDVSESNW